MSAEKQLLIGLLDEAFDKKACHGALPGKRLLQKPAGSRYTNLALIRGIAAHDLYHAGQIQLLKRLDSVR
jgi:hypothetical protein